MARRALARHIISTCLHGSSSTQALATAPAALATASLKPCLALLQPRAWAQPQAVQLALYAKHTGKGKAKGKAADPVSEQPPIEFNLDEPTAAMQQTIERFQHELAGVRTGRANPGLIESLTVDHQGDRMPLKACGTVTVRGAQTLAVAVYDPAVVADVVNAIRASPLSLNPQTEGGEILVKVPKLSRETIEKMVKLVHMEAEAAKVSIRHARQKALDLAKKAFNSSDERKGAEKRVQALTDNFIAEVDRIKGIKDKELREHES